MKLKTYHYDGPEPLRSVINQNCAAIGLYSVKEDADIVFKACQNKEYQLDIKIKDDKQIKLTGELSSDGRSLIGQQILEYLRELLGIEMSEWGNLVGVRPTKLFHKKWDNLGSVKEAEEYLKEERKVSDKKIDLLKRITALQKKYLNNIDDKTVSLYAGIPFCTSHCAYCSFPFGLVQQFKQLKNFEKAYISDCQTVGTILKENNINVDTVYMGGGTPTSLSDELFARVLKEIAKLVPKGNEFTVEAGRPDTVTNAKISAMKELGVNRISINPQTMQDDLLKRIGRNHSAKSITELFNLVRKETDFDVNMDFIAGLPGQTVADMKVNMDYVCQKMPENVTIHTLALKKGSPLYASRLKEEVPSSSDVKYMVDYCASVLEEAGYVPYYLYRQKYMSASMENIGYTLPGKECVYNIQMMEERQSILSIGPGSTSKWITPQEFRQIKQYMPRDVNIYIEKQEELQKKRMQIANNFLRKD